MSPLFVVTEIGTLPPRAPEAKSPGVAKEHWLNEKLKLNDGGAANAFAKPDSGEKLNPFQSHMPSGRRLGMDGSEGKPQLQMLFSRFVSAFRFCCTIASMLCSIERSIPRFCWRACVKP